MKEQLYFLDISPARAYLRKWQRVCYNKCLEYNRHIFTKDKIMALYNQLVEMGKKMWGFGNVFPPDFNFCDQYGLDPYIALGGDCSVYFVTIKGEAEL